ncbi:hypothetical protein PIB30_056358 [Stylosanthes scabra]|uniref:Uncharacterized protein n=1 Tax=Stylosanthes scabra TaxID=79078 RepID=A0ABU6QJ72_9FABA|nr:hypothetical protein [Stylosanthes scabra]
MFFTIAAAVPRKKAAKRGGGVRRMNRLNCRALRLPLVTVAVAPSSTVENVHSLHTKALTMALPLSPLPPLLVRVTASPSPVPPLLFRFVSSSTPSRTPACDCGCGGFGGGRITLSDVDSRAASTSCAFQSSSPVSASDQITQKGCNYSRITENRFIAWKQEFEVFLNLIQSGNA